MMLERAAVLLFVVSLCSGEPQALARALAHSCVGACSIRYLSCMANELGTQTAAATQMQGTPEFADAMCSCFHTLYDPRCNTCTPAQNTELQLVCSQTRACTANQCNWKRPAGRARARRGQPASTEGGSVHRAAQVPPFVVLALAAVAGALLLKVFAMRRARGAQQRPERELERLRERQQQAAAAAEQRALASSAAETKNRQRGLRQRSTTAQVAGAAEAPRVDMVRARLWCAAWRR